MCGTTRIRRRRGRGRGREEEEEEEEEEEGGGESLIKKPRFVNVSAHLEGAVADVDAGLVAGAAQHSKVWQQKQVLCGFCQDRSQFSPMRVLRTNWHCLSANHASSVEIKSRIGNSYTPTHLRSLASRPLS